ncbi:HET domain-containing protein [Phlyctema vagabunda]|uniref:HET domain-containing protein n=1 Tax=Phlyctema vagabunda TaxID=108571 RepID=A0ABR4PH41_9HELO
MPRRNLPVNPDVWAPRHLDLMGFWYHTLTDYVQRRISNQQDILPAISGIAKIIAERSGYTYYAGLWLEDIHRGLLWQPLDVSKKSGRYKRPSWSWVSTDLPWIEMDDLRLHTYQPGPRAFVINMQVSTVGDDPYAKVLSSKLQLRGEVQTVGQLQAESKLIIFDNSHNYFTRMRVLNRWRKPEYVSQASIPPYHRIICHMDELNPLYEDQIRTELQFNGAILLVIAKFGHKWPPDVSKNAATVFALVLQPTDFMEEEYERIGIAEMAEEDFETIIWDERTITII